ncbi:ABC transporter permease subunit [Dactylosporangium fulvum]|uniref:Maltose/maltodextrin transport system permease protein n=1 Tax=Dactylosporangium fulvum TaxID=53359 RepID=A0ABY5WDF2_9ACTN|nr:ABC transporter permease subunit [Dactylosporangium fulvum]UWP87239.1 ABC transporter permease subunit [Dactylosporangium fulvum]
MPNTHPRGTLVKIVVLGLALALAVYAAFPLVDAHAWGWLAVLVVVTGLIFAVYLTPVSIPAKYLVPGVLFLLAFQVVPVLYTATTAFSNYGDGHRGSKQDAIVAVQSASVQQVPGSPEYTLSVADAEGSLVFLLVDGDGTPSAGTRDGLRPLDPGRVTVTDGRITAADGYTLLNLAEASLRNDEILAFTVPTADGAVRASGLTRAYDGRATRFYDKACDCVTDRGTGRRWVADPDSGSFVAADGERLAQGWKVDVGLTNFTRVLTDTRISGPFLSTLAWNLGFAVGSVLVTFALGLGCALALNADRLRGRTVYRILLVLPYAMPAFAMLLVWRDLFNQDFGLINRVFGLHVDWFGEPWTARLAVILVQLWLGYPYMFLVATGALQAIPKEMGEAASVDGATAGQRFRRITLPLLLVALSPLLISSFAFNFNNFNAIYLTTEGGPFPPGNSSVGATDLLITYTYRLAFGTSGAQFGFAAAISVYIFAIVAIISVVGFRRSRRQEEVYA